MKGVPLTITQIIEICNRLVDGGPDNVGHKRIARDYNVEHAAISAISRMYLDRKYVWKTGANRELVKRATSQTEGYRAARVHRTS